MTDKWKNNENLGELFRYSQNKMSEKERYNFERALERDPFLAEALDGIVEFKASDIERDLKSIDLIEGKTRKPIKPIVYLSVAASIVIVVVSFLVFNSPKIEKQLVQQKKEKSVGKTNVDTLFKEPAIKQNPATFDSSYVLMAEASTPELKKEIPTKTIEKQANNANVSDSSVAIKKKAETPKIASIAALKSQQSEDALRMNEEETSAGVAQEIVGSSTQSKPIVENITEELNGNENLKRAGVNADPQPFGGMSLFKDYLDANTKYPQSEEKAKRETVKVQFNVSVLGEVQNITILKGPDNQDFSKEAIRVLKNGPKWSPAVKDGIPVTGEVSIRIVFKP